jgi:hypothetical protein
MREERTTKQEGRPLLLGGKASREENLICRKQAERGASSERSKRGLGRHNIDSDTI